MSTHDKLDQTGARRLERLAKLLDAHRDNGVRFTLATWVEKNLSPDNVNGVTRFEALVEDGWCGTAACAIGLAMLDRGFNKLGFGRASGRFPIPSFKNRISWDAVQAFFRISSADARYLFGAKSYTEHNLPTTGDDGARVVATRIRGYIDGCIRDQIAASAATKTKPGKSAAV